MFAVVRHGGVSFLSRLKQGFDSPRERHAANYARNINIIFLVYHVVRVQFATSAF